MALESNVSAEEVHLVVASTMYEGYDVLCAFSAQADAVGFAQQCREYDTTLKESPPIDATDDVWEHWTITNRAWEDAHPAKPFSQRSYDVLPVRFRQC
jgi:hypothetical protein